MTSPYMLARCGAGLFLFAWCGIVFLGAPYKLHNPVEQDSCVINAVADYYGVPARVDCSKTGVLDALVLMGNVGGSLTSVAIVDEQDKASMNCREASDCLAALLKVEYSASSAATASYKGRIEDADEISLQIDVIVSQIEAKLKSRGTGRDDLDGVAEYRDRKKRENYFSPFHVGSGVFGGDGHQCSSRHFSYDVADYYNYLMGDTCASALENRCIYDRFQYITLLICSGGVLAIYCIMTFRKEAGLRMILFGSALLIVIITLPIMSTVQTERTVQNSFAKIERRYELRGSATPPGSIPAGGYSRMGPPRSMQQGHGPSKAFNFHGGSDYPSKGQGSFSDHSSKNRRAEKFSSAQKQLKTASEKSIGKKEMDEKAYYLDELSDSSLNPTLGSDGGSFGVTEALDFAETTLFAAERIDRLLSLGTEMHTRPSQCGIKWTEPIKSVAKLITRPTTVRTLTQRGFQSNPYYFTGVFGEILQTVFDLLEYEVEFTSLYYLRGVTAFVGAVLLGDMVLLIFSKRLEGYQTISTGKAF